MAQGLHRLELGLTKPKIEGLGSLCAVLEQESRHHHRPPCMIIYSPGTDPRLLRLFGLESLPAHPRADWRVWLVNPMWS